MLKNYRKKFIDIILTLAMVISLMPTMPLTASAATISAVPVMPIPTYSPTTASSIVFDFEASTEGSKNKIMTQSVSSNTIQLVSSTSTLIYVDPITASFDIPNGSGISGGFVSNYQGSYETKVEISLSNGCLFSLNTMDMIEAFGNADNVILVAKKGSTTSGTVSHSFSGNDAYQFNTLDDVNFQNISSIEITTTDNQFRLAFDNIVLNNIQAPEAPTIQAKDTTVVVGDKTSFTVGATGSNIEYQWQVNLGSGFFNTGDGYTYIGSKTPTLTITKATADMNGRYYRCIVTSSNGLSVTSNIAKLTVNTPPTINSQPSDSIIKFGENTSFTVGASATDIHYQWQVKKGSSFTDIIDDNIYSGATTATLNIKEATGDMNGYTYQVIISGTVPTPVTSNPVTLTVHTPPAIDINTPSDNAVAVDGSTSFTVMATGSNLEYQWQVYSGGYFFNAGDGFSYMGAKTPTLTITKATANMNGKIYRCVVTSPEGLYSTSKNATLMVGTVTTQAVSGIHSTTATCNGNITTIVVPNLTQHGVVWSTTENPDVSLSTKTELGAVYSIGAFTSNITGLNPNTTYHVRAYATNAEGTIYGSDVTFTTSTSLNGGSVTQSDGTNTTAEDKGKKQDVWNLSTTVTGGKIINTITVDETKLAKLLENSKIQPTVTLSSNSDASIVVGQLNGQMVKNMESKSAILEIKTGTVTYTLPASRINIDLVSSQIGTQAELKDIKVSVKIAEPSSDTVEMVQDTANKNGYQLIVKPVEFEIICTSGDKTIEVNKFNGYVERLVAIPDGVDSSRITTGVVLNKDGSLNHVPTTIVVINGKCYAKISSLTNSTYSIIYNHVTFTDVTNHWAEKSINDMGSRMVVSGNETGNYNPDKNITRAEFAAISVRALGLSKGIAESNFGDITLSDWYNGYIDTATSYGLITGYDATFYGPNDMITREQAMIITARAMTKTGLNINLTDSEVSELLEKYTDGEFVSDFARESVATCLKSGVVTGTGESMLSPKSYITRAEVAVMIQRLLQKSDLI